MPLDAVTGASVPVLVVLCGVAGACAAASAWLAGSSAVGIGAAYFLTAFGLLAAVIWVVVVLPRFSRRSHPPLRSETPQRSNGSL
jgi:high-affinity Fe2+/Pb2+ permease